MNETLYSHAERRLARARQCVQAWLRNAWSGCDAMLHAAAAYVLDPRAA
jgi:hypothetical protein